MKKYFKQILLTLLMLPMPASADSWHVDTIFGTVNSTSEPMHAWGNFLDLSLNFLYGMIGLVAIVRVVYGAMKYTQASGNAAEAKQAKRIILHAFYGLVLVLSAYVITITFLDI